MNPPRSTPKSRTAHRWTGAFIVTFVLVMQAAAAETRRPNILFIISDDQRPDTIAALGTPAKMALPNNFRAEHPFVVGYFTDTPRAIREWPWKLVA